jgi:hypothetical protein
VGPERPTVAPCKALQLRPNVLAPSGLPPGAGFRESRAHPGRVLEVSLLANFVPMPFALDFEGFPLWLLALERSFCKKLTIMGWLSAGALKASLEATGKQLKLAHRALAHLGLGRVAYQASFDAPAGAITLVSGSPVYLEASARRLAGAPALFLCSSHWKGRRSPSEPALLRLQHRRFGGPTHFVTLFGSQGLQARPVETQLRRTVGHVFDHGTRPDPVWDVSRVPPASVLTLDSILYPDSLFRAVLHPTSFFGSGWGVRPLTMDELGISFGFPAWLRAGGVITQRFPHRPNPGHGCLLAFGFGVTTFLNPLGYTCGGAECDGPRRELVADHPSTFAAFLD